MIIALLPQLKPDFTKWLFSSNPSVCLTGFRFPPPYPTVEMTRQHQKYFYKKRKYPSQDATVNKNEEEMLLKEEKHKVLTYRARREKTGGCERPRHLRT